MNIYNLSSEVERNVIKFEINWDGEDVWIIANALFKKASEVILMVEFVGDFRVRL